ncbi:MAG: pirin family protein [Leptospiraceae bacterium]|nr:pirin family protein [Leptospiraceae bacterium]MCP5512327.1 pirin family protein [Leptospiraceae bacterium]
MEETIRNVFPLGFQWETRDPFLFCAHHEDFYPRGNGQLGPDADLNGRFIGQDFVPKDGWRMYHGTRTPGFPAHPHRGFETVTIVRKGYVDHADSLGASGRYGDGDVQWLTAGKGIQHSEMFPLIKEDSSNPLELFQIWLNLPSRNKFAKPDFKMFWNEDIPVLNFSDRNDHSIQIELIAGALGEKTALSPPPDSWASSPENRVTIWLIQLSPHSIWTLPKDQEGLNRTLYFFKGSDLQIDGQSIPPYHGIDLLSEREVDLQNGEEETQILLLQGKPIAEPVYQYGPFVMNSEQEIQNAFSDFRRTQFGGWPWKDSEPTHGLQNTKFANLPNQKE